MAVNAWNPAPGADNSNYRQCAAILHNELENQFRHTWGDTGGDDNPALWDHYLQHGPNGDDGMASLATGVVNRLLATRQQNDTQTLQKVWDLKNANPNAALTDLSSADYAYLKFRGLDANALAILQSHPASDDPGLFNQLHRQATQDPVNFGKANLLAQSGKLSRAHMQTLQNLQDAINKQDPQAMQAGKRIDMTVNALMGDGPSAATDDASANAGADIHAREDQAQKLEAGLRDHLIAAQQSDPKLSLQDLHAAGAYFMRDWSLYGDGDAAPTDAEQQARSRAVVGPFDSSASSGSEADQASSNGEVSAGHDPAAHDPAAQDGGANPKPSQVPEGDTRASLGRGEASPADGAAAAVTEGGDAHHQNAPADKESSLAAKQQNLSLDEFNKFALLAGTWDYRSQRAAKNKKKMVVTPDEKKRLMEMQQRLGVKQTGSFDNTTRRALNAEFIDLIRPAAEAEERKSGIPAAVTIGQACLETGYGLHLPTDVKTGQRSNNLFGIKAVNEQPAVNSWTHEYDEKGNLVSVVQPFAVYDSIGGSIPAHSAFLKKYRNYRSLFSSSDAKKWAQGLQDAGYGGKNNKKYAGQLINVMRTWKLIK